MPQEELFGIRQKIGLGGIHYIKERKQQIKEGKTNATGFPNLATSIFTRIGVQARRPCVNSPFFIVETSIESKPD